MQQNYATDTIRRLLVAELVLIESLNKAQSVHGHSRFLHPRPTSSSAAMKISDLLCSSPESKEEVPAATAPPGQEAGQRQAQMVEQASSEMKFAVVPDNQRKRAHRLSSAQKQQRRQNEADESRLYNLTLDVNELRQQIHQSTERRDLHSTRLLPRTQAQPHVLSDSDSGVLFAPPVRSAPTPTPVPIAAPTPAVATSVPPARPLINQQISSDDDSDDWSDDDGGHFGVATAKAITAPIPVVASTPAPALSQVAAPSGSLFEPPTGTAAPVVQPPIPSAAARMRASGSDSDSDWDDDGGLFGPAKK